MISSFYYIIKSLGSDVAVFNILGFSQPCNSCDALRYTAQKLSSRRRPGSPREHGYVEKGARRYSRGKASSPKERRELISELRLGSKVPDF